MTTKTNTNARIVMTAEEANAIALRMMKERLESRTNLRRDKKVK